MSIFTPTYTTTMYVREYTPYVVLTLFSSTLLLITLSIWNMLEVFINNNLLRTGNIQEYRYNTAIIASVMGLGAIGYERVIDILFPRPPLYYLIYLWLISITPYIVTIILGFLLYDYISSQKKGKNMKQSIRDENKE